MDMESGPSRRKRIRGEGSGSGGGGGEQVVSVGSNCGTIELDALDCNLCCHPLRPPVFQCAMGHAICSSCHGKLVNKDKCHVCSITGGYNRCIVVEQILESVYAPCSYSMYGCTVKTHYLKRADHENSCPCTPCFCPEDCGFIGPTPELLNHLTEEHDWPSTEFQYEHRSILPIQEGMHVLYSKEGGCLFLVKFTPMPPLGNVVSILCVHPYVVTVVRKFRCLVVFNCNIIGWQQCSNFYPKSTNLSNGLPTEDGSFSLLVPAAPSDMPAPNTIKLTISKES